MLAREARWFRRQLERMPDGDVFPLLNVGSHTAEFRATGQPWIDGELFRPLADRGGRVVHTDIRPAAGVDLVGDLLDPAFRDELRQRRFRSVMFCNVLEHVSDREPIARTVADVVAPGGLLLVSCPHRFPYHPDPIDTLYRPSVSELASLFPGTSLIHGQIVPCGNLTTYVLGRASAAPVAFLRTMIQPRGVKSPHETAAPSSHKLALLPWLIRTFAVTCIVLRKED